MSERKPTATGIDFPTLDLVVNDIARTFERGHLDDETVEALLAGVTPHDKQGRPIQGLEGARWAKEAAIREARTWSLQDPRGRIVARLVHGRGEPAWTYSVWNEADGQLK